MEIRVSLPAALCGQPLNGSEELTSTAYPQRRRVTHVLGDNHQAIRLIPSDNGQEVKSIRPSMLTAVVVGEEQEGPQLPLNVTALKSE